MIKRLNRFLRFVFVAFGAFYFLVERLPQKARQDHREGFDNEEFDDIW